MTSIKCAHLGRRMTTVRPCLSVRGMTKSFPVASFAMSSHLISWGLYVFLLRAHAGGMAMYTKVAQQAVCRSSKR